MKGAFRIPVYGGGAAPDPATYCPANGYILNPILPADGWNLLAEFQTNSPYTTTFDPVITASSGQYAWDLGDGTIIFNDKAISHTYATTATRTVKLYGKGTCTVLTIDFNSDSIVGGLDLSNDCFKSLTSVQLYTNIGLTGFTLPVTMTGILTTFRVDNTSCSGELDLSGYSQINQLTFYCSNCSGVTGLKFAASVTGSVYRMEISYCDITGDLDLQWFTSTPSIGLIFNSRNNANLTDLIFNPLLSGTLYSLESRLCSLTGVIDLSMWDMGNTGNGGVVAITQNSLLTGITFKSSPTGKLGNIGASLCDITGALDLSMFSDFGPAFSLDLRDNLNLTAVNFAASVSGLISYFQIYNTGITSMDLSMFSGFTASAYVGMYSNSSLATVTFKSSVTGIIKTLYLNSNAVIGYSDLSMLSTSINSMYWRFDWCNWSAATVNQVLAVLDSISTGGYTSRIISIAGSNADPDSSSGGYDGLAAKASLESKGFTVTIT